MDIIIAALVFALAYFVLDASIIEAMALGQLAAIVVLLQQIKNKEEKE